MQQNERKLTTMRKVIEGYWRDLRHMAHVMPFAALARLTEVLLECHRHGGTIFTLGNGGSAATASHFACDLAKGTRAEGLAAFRVVALTDNMPLLTAWANDTSYGGVFAEQVAALVRAGDVVIAISASGNSPNVLTVPEVARQAGAVTVALTGRTGGRLARQADLAIRVPPTVSSRWRTLTWQSHIVSVWRCAITCTPRLPLGWSSARSIRMRSSIWPS